MKLFFSGIEVQLVYLVSKFFNLYRVSMSIYIYISLVADLYFPGGTGCPDS